MLSSWTVAVCPRVKARRLVWICDRQPILLENPEHHYLRQQLEELLDALWAERNIITSRSFKQPDWTWWFRGSGALPASVNHLDQQEHLCSCLFLMWMWTLREPLWFLLQDDAEHHLRCLNRDQAGFRWAVRRLKKHLVSKHASAVLPSLNWNKWKIQPDQSPNPSDVPSLWMPAGF